MHNYTDHDIGMAIISIRLSIGLIHSSVVTEQLNWSSYSSFIRSIT